MPRRFVPYDITICGVSELPKFSAAGVTHVVSILDPHTPDPDFSAYGNHRRIDFRFHDIIEQWEGHQPPHAADVERIIQFGQEIDREAPEHVLVHCFAGVSRSSAAAIILMLRRNPGREEEILEAVRAIRPKAWPNSLMIRHADEKLGSKGRLIGAVRNHYRLVGRNNPDFVDFIRSVGRGAEVED